MAVKRTLQPITHQSFFLFGPRGTGKTSWLKEHYPDSLYINLLLHKNFFQLSKNPDLLISLILPEHKGKPIIIDEVQKVPALLDVVHTLIEEQKLNFILTGSSARKLKQKGVNLLAGRARKKEMHPLTALELGDRFNLKFALEHGQLPTVYNVDDPKEYLDSYVGTYLQEEVQGESLVRNLNVFHRFLEAATFSQASILSVLNIAKDCKIDRNTAESYFGILEDLLIAIRLPVFNKKAKRKTITHRKFYYFDVGVFRALRPTGPLDLDSELNGIALETLIFQELRAYQAYSKKKSDLYFWRSVKDEEVDFILYGEIGLRAIEVTISSRMNHADFESLLEFKKDYPIAQLYYLYTGDQRLVIQGIQVIPVDYFLKNMNSIFDEVI
jgi:predicted AAA+ superfamily ATPase